MKDLFCSAVWFDVPDIKSIVKLVNLGGGHALSFYLFFPNNSSFLKIFSEGGKLLGPKIIKNFLRFVKNLTIVVVLLHSDGSSSVDDENSGDLATQNGILGQLCGRATMQHLA